MATQEQEIHTLVARDIPDDFQNALVALVVTSYREELLTCADEFDAPELHDLLPHRRRARIQRALRSLARAHGGQVTTQTNIHGGAYHTLVRFGSVVLTESAVIERFGKRIPKQAMFRELYAGGDQLTLFSPESERIESLVEAYGIIIHGPRDCYGPAPSFIFLGFPQRDCRSYVAQVDLTARLRDMLTNDPSIEQISPELELKLRDIRKRKEQSDE